MLCCGSAGMFYFLSHTCESVGQRSRLRRLKNGFPQGSVLTPLLFNIYISDLLTTISRKYAYADDLAIMHADEDWQAVEGALSKDMAMLGEYLQTWKLTLSTTKTVSEVFHLNNKEAKRELKVNFNNETLPFCSQTQYHGVMLGRSLMYRRHLESIRKELTLRVALLRRHSGSSWGARATTLRTATLALVHSTAEHCAPVWCCSAHTRLIDPTINDALRFVTGCLRPAPEDNLPILAGIQPAEIRRSGATYLLDAVPWSLDICFTQRSPVHRVLLHSASNRETHLYLPQSNSSASLTTITYVRRSGRIINGTWSGRTTPQDSAL